MTDKNDDDAGRRPPRGRPPARAPRGDRPDRPPRARDDSDRPARSGSGDRNARPRREDGDRPFRKPGGDRPARAGAAGGDRPFRGKPAGDRPQRARPEGDRPARAGGDRPFRGKPAGDRPFRKPEGDRPLRPRPDGDRPARPRREEGDRPFRARSNDGERSFGGDRPFRGKPPGDRPTRGPRPEGDRPYRPRPEGDRPFRSRPDGDRPARGPRPGGDKPYRPRPEGDRPFRPRPDGAPRLDAERPRRSDTEAPRPPRKPRAGADRPKRVLEAVPANAEPVEERIAKVMARAGVASRRDAEKMIEAGRVTLNGEVVASPALNVLPDADIAIDGEPLPQKERTRLWMFHKPRGLVTTARDPEGRPTVFDSMPAELPRVVAVGRLDINTEGLLLLTNDGGLARVLAHPTTGWLRRYKVRAYGDIDQATLDGLRDGISIDGVDYGPIEARLDRQQGDNTWLTLGLREGKNREIKVILEHLGLQVNRLIRMSFGPFQLGDLEMGLVEEVPTRVLRDQLGEALAQEAGVDFASPVREPVDESADDHEERRPDRRDERPARPRTGDDRPRRPRDDRPIRARPGDERPARGGKPERRGRDGDRPAREEAPARPARRTAWRADEETAEPKAFKPRRKSDPATERTANAERPRERVGAIKGAKGGKVLVERLVARPKEEADDRPARRPRSDARPAGAEGGRPPRDSRPPRDGAPPRRGPPSGGRGGPPKGRRS